MATQHARPAAVTLPGGDVLVAGGYQYSAPQDHWGAGSRKGEIFESSTGSFTAVSDQMSTGHWNPGGAALGDGRVLIAGGQTGGEWAAATAKSELYDPASEEFTETDQMADQRANPVAAPLPDGRAIVAGGNHYVLNGEGKKIFVTMSSTELYDPATEEFSSGASMAVPRAAAVAAPLPDGRVIVIGGFKYAPAAPVVEQLSSTEIYDPVTESFEAGPAMPFSEAEFGATLENGRILITTRSTIWEYDPATETFVDTEISSTPYVGAAAAALPNGRALLAGHTNYKYGSEGKEAWVYVTAPLAAEAGIDFGKVPLAETTGPETLTIANEGAQALEVSATSLAGADAARFEIVADECSGKSLALGEECAIEVTVTPTAAGSLSASVQLTDNAPSGPHSFALSAKAE